MLGLGIGYRRHRRGLPSPPTMPASVQVYLNAADALVNGAVLRNRMASDPDNVDENVILYDTGNCKQHGSGSAPIYGLDGEWVTWRAATVGDVFHFGWFNNLPTAGAAGIAWQVRSEPGEPAFAVQYGNSANLQAGTTLADSDPDWADPDRVLQDLVLTGIGTNNNNYGIRGDGTNLIRIQIRRVVMQYGVAAAALPAWEDVKRGCGDLRRELAWPNSLTKVGNALDSSTGAARCAFRDPDPDYQAGQVYRPVTATSGLVLLEFVDGGAASLALAPDINTGVGVSGATLGIGINSSDLVLGYPSGVGAGLSGWLRYNPIDQGYVPLGYCVTDGDQRFWLGELDFNFDTDPWAGFDCNIWRVGGQTTATASKARIRAVVKSLDSSWTQAEKVQVMATLAYDLGLVGDEIAPLTFMALLASSEMSNTPPGGDRVIDIITEGGYFGPEPNLAIYQFANGGETVASMAATDLPRLLIMAEQATWRGNTAIVFANLGGPDSALMVADPVAYEQLQIDTYWTPLRAVARSQRLYMVAGNLTAISVPGYNAALVTYQTQLLAHLGRDSDPAKIYNNIVDFQSTAVGISNLAEILADPSVWFQEDPDFTHPNAAGTLEMVPPVVAVVEDFFSWRAAL